MVSYIAPPDWYNEAYFIFNYVICVLQFFGFGINLIHFSILTRPHMRSNSIYRLMIGICSCDLLTQVNTFLIFSPFWIRDSSIKEEQCYMTLTYFDAFLHLHGTTVLDITQRGASWMALFMALYRTLSVMFPLNPRIQKLSKPVFAVWTILGVLVFTSLTTWMVQARRIIKPYDWDYDCDKNEIHLNETRYGVLVPNEFSAIQSKLVSTYGFIKALPSLIDPILTFFLILELRRASKRRKNCGKCSEDRTDNTTKLVMFVTISFFLLEVPNGLSHVVNGFFYDNVPVRTISVMVPVFAEILPVVNSSSHFFICILMSTQYRETAKNLFRRAVGRHGKITFVEECNSTKTHNSVKKEPVFVKVT
ncbi:hypothetical protein CAEBREN_07039 [Caenorhabditis brenneri]|uniref:G-protein coupled receptors family 1 profile domain-containing protein n=1 Tax=Caenorhabditis brenneri TaxID=135651 RepID=G0M8Z3_CAEBE|nr:hypothetical protein CAEBREN_07039 [Caenorhabditis brenneri]